MLQISKRVFIPDEEIIINAIRSGGPGGQHVNKVASAIHLKFDIGKSSLPDLYKERLLKLQDKRISKEGVITIKAQEQRSQKRNRDSALDRLQELIRGVMITRRKRIATRPTKSSQTRRLDSKSRHSKIKKLRGRIEPGE